MLRTHSIGYSNDNEKITFNNGHGLKNVTCKQTLNRKIKIRRYWHQNLNKSKCIDCFGRKEVFYIVLMTP